MGSSESSVIAASYAGQFYPATGEKLQKQLEKFFSGAGEKQGAERPRALIAPHAGYIFSGQVAASAYHQIPANTFYKRVFILASSHRFSFSGAGVCKSDTYRTPLGDVKLDAGVARQLVDAGSIFRYHQACVCEHSLEVQLPFLQYRLGNDFKLVLIVLGTGNTDECKTIANLLEPWFTPENLFVVSTDFSHYPSYDQAVENDLNTALAICSNNPEKLLQQVNMNRDIQNLATSLCGWTSVTTLMYLTQNKNFEYRKIKYQNSGDSKDYDEKKGVVGYWALAVFEDHPVVIVSAEEEQELLMAARDAIRYFVETSHRSLASLNETSEILIQPAGLFVSIFIDDELRGCIGNFNNDESLNQLVKQLAVSAACDRRFKNISLEELDTMELEISVLSPMRKIYSTDEIIPGKHGIYIKKGSNSGTFLPKVAVKTGWSREELLGRCARDKAGIGWNGWKTAELYIYEVFVFKG